MSVLALLVVLGAVFVLGLLIGQQWNRRTLAARERELVIAHRRQGAGRVFDRDDPSHDPRGSGTGW